MLKFLIILGIAFISIIFIMFLLLLIFNKIDNNKWNNCKNQASEKCNLNNFDCINCPFYDSCIKK